MSVILRVLSVIDLFTEAKPIWTADELIEAQATSRATTYRDLKALVDAGFLAPVSAGAFALGPRFIELDRQIRLGDPLLKIAPPIMASQREKVGGTQLLCRYYGLRVMSIHEDRYDERIKTSFDRGRPVSLFTSSTSRSSWQISGPISSSAYSFSMPAKLQRRNSAQTGPHSGIACASSGSAALPSPASSIRTWSAWPRQSSRHRTRSPLHLPSCVSGKRLMKLPLTASPGSRSRPRKVSERLQAVTAREMAESLSGKIMLDCIAFSA